MATGRWPLVVLGAVLACGGGRTRDDSGAEHGEEGDVPDLPSYEEPYCDETVTALASMSEASPVGISGDDVVEHALGEQTMALHWDAGGGEVELEVPDAPNPYTELTMTVSDAGNPRFVERTEVYPEGSNGEAIECPSLVRVDATLTAVTADGVLDASWMLTLELAEDGPDGLSDGTAIFVDALDVDVAVNVVQPAGWKLDHFLLWATFTETSAEGEIRVIVQNPEQPADDLGAALASWEKQ